MLVLGVIIIVLGGLYAALGLYQAVTDRAIWSVLPRPSCMPAPATGAGSTRRGAGRSAVAAARSTR